MLNWHDTWRTTRDTQPDVGLWPIGRIEPHGTHLPVGTHCLLLNVIAQAVAARLPYETYLLPTWPFGTSVGHRGSPGTAYVRWETLLEVVFDVVESLYEQGIPRVVVPADLGGANESPVRPRGNYIVMTAVRQLNYAHPSRRTIWVQPFTAAREDSLHILDSALEDVQAGEVETSCLMAVHPHLAKTPAADAIPLLSKEYLDHLPFASISAEGVWGVPPWLRLTKGCERWAQPRRRRASTSRRLSLCWRI
jgi:creatinine amidohydrolase